MRLCWTSVQWQNLSLLNVQLHCNQWKLKGLITDMIECVIPFFNVASSWKNSLQRRKKLNKISQIMPLGSILSTLRIAIIKSFLWMCYPLWVWPFLLLAGTTLLSILHRAPQSEHGWTWWWSCSNLQSHRIKYNKITSLQCIYSCM